MKIVTKTARSRMTIPVNEGTITIGTIDITACVVVTELLSTSESVRPSSNVVVICESLA